jgi:hypothetical protein
MLNHGVFPRERTTRLLSTIAFGRPVVKMDGMEDRGPHDESSPETPNADDDRQMGPGPRSPDDAEPANLADEQRVRQQQQQQQQ